MHKNSRFTMILAVFLLLYSVASVAAAADLPAEDKKLIEDAGVVLFPGAVFVNGSQDVGFRFATKKPVAEVQSWYADKMKGWNLYSKYGGWILHNGPAGIGMGEVMSKNQVQVQKNDNLAGWFGIDKSLSTEIVIMIPNDQWKK